MIPPSGGAKRLFDVARRLFWTAADRAPIFGHDVRAVQNVLAPLVKLGDEKTCNATNSRKNSESDHSGFLRMWARSFAGERSRRQLRPDVKVKR